MLKDFFWPRILKTADLRKHFFHQDGATPHTTNTVQTCQQENLAARSPV